MNRRAAMSLLAVVPFANCGKHESLDVRPESCESPLFADYVVAHWRNDDGEIEITDGCGLRTSLVNRNLSMSNGVRILGLGDEGASVIVKKGDWLDSSVKSIPEIVLVDLVTGARSTVRHNFASSTYYFNQTRRLLIALEYHRSNDMNPWELRLSRYDFSREVWTAASPVFRSRVFPKQFSVLLDFETIVLSLDDKIYSINIVSEKIEKIGEGKQASVSSGNVYLACIDDANKVNILDWPSLRFNTKSNVPSVDGLRWCPGTESGIFASHYPPRHILGAIGVDTLYWMRPSSPDAISFATQRHSIGVLAFGFLKNDPSVINALRSLKV